MNLYLRLLRLLLLIPFVRRRDIFAESHLSFRVWPNDCDLNFHMNNGRYLTFMDLGRMHLLVQIGLFKLLLKYRWTPVLSGAEISFIRSLPPFGKFTLVTRMLTWDEKYFYLEQRFERGDVLCALATVRGLFVTGGRTVPSADVLRALGVDAAPPAMPTIVSHWKELAALKKEQSARSA
ncbi:MAG: thioesterase family protein [Gammaproteobacteria bacterium]|nr:thioesterase family protein [Gammaproteobacteria bacterium]